MDKLIYKEESYRIIGCCMEVHKTLGKGFSEIVIKKLWNMNFSRIQFHTSERHSVRYRIKGLFLEKGLMLILFYTKR